MMDAAVGSSTTCFHRPTNRRRSAIANVLESGQPFQYDVQVGDRWFAVRLDPVPPREEVEPSVVAVIGDVTEPPSADEERARLLANTERARKEAEISRLEAEAARAEAEQASRAKSEFLAVMSHELRTPLNAIDGYAELLELELRGPITPAQRDDIRRIRRSQKHLLSLINDVLNFVRLDAGSVRYEISDVRARRCHYRRGGRDGAAASRAPAALRAPRLRCRTPRARGPREGRADPREPDDERDQVHGA